MRVVIAEDEEITRQCMTDLLEAWGHQVTQAADGAQALEAVLTSSEPVDILLTDWMMPTMDGLELARRVREFSERSDYIYIILATARSGVDDVLKGFKEGGVDDYVIKPFEASELQARVQMGERVVRLERAQKEYSRGLERLVQQQTLKIRQTQAVMESIITSMSDGVMLIDAGGRIALANPALRGILEAQQGELVGTPWEEAMAPAAHNQAFQQLLRKATQKSLSCQHQQVSYLTPERKTKNLMVTTSPLTVEMAGRAEAAGLLVVLNDISQLMELHRRENELLLQSRRLVQEKLEGLDRLARSVAHEIRNPVTTIGGLTRRLLNHKQDKDTQAEYLTRILSGARHLEKLVTQVRAYADLPPPQLATEDLGTVLGRIASTYAERTRIIGVDLSLEGAVGQAGRMQALVDAGLLEMVLRTLMDNALEAMPGGGRLKLGLEENQGQAVITVADTGRGISAGELPYLFDPFFTTKPEAVGMSLAIAKRIALENKWDLNAVSEEGQGAVFTLAVPLRLTGQD